MGMKSTTGGEIIQVQGGHIVRSTGRKDRHSKVYTAKGPRDRRVRLSAHTAIQFYDVQDRLGYDRPSKAVDWLIKKAKSAIDKLAELPPWDPNAGPSTDVEVVEPNNGGGSGEMAIAEQSESSGYNYQLHRHLGEATPNNDSSSFAAPQLERTSTDISIADTMKSFFPTSTTASSINFQNYPHAMISRTADSSEDLGLSLHPFQDQGLLHQGQSHGDAAAHAASTEHHQSLFGASGPVGFETNFQRMVGWGGSDASGENRNTGFVFNSLQLPQQQALLGHQGSAFSQRGPLQSSFSQSVRSWNDVQIPPTAHHKTHEIHQASIFGSRFAVDGLQGFNIPSRIQVEEDNSAASERPTSSSPNSHH